MKNLALAVALTSMAAVATAQEAPGRPPSMTPGERAEFDAALDLPGGPGTGPYPAIMETDSTIAEHVVYRPADLSPFKGRKLGVLVWGNGGCRADGSRARHHLLEIASHGYLVIAPGRILSGPTATGREAGDGRDANGQRLTTATTARDVRTGLDWALTENNRKGSRYYRLIDPQLTAVAGHSCGGLQALEVASDPRIHAVLIHNSGVFNDGAQPIQGYTVSKSMLTGLHTPVIYFLGGPGDIAWPNGTDDVRRIEHVAVVQVAMPVGHGGTFAKPNGGAVAQASVDWLEWQLRGNYAAGRSFTGASCRLCVVPGWDIVKKRIP